MTMDRLKRSLRDAPIVDRDGYQYFVHPITDGVPPLEPALLREIVVGVVRRAAVEEVDAIVAPEAMGIHVGTAVSLAADKPLAVVRKRSYGFAGEVAVHQETGYSEGELYVNGVDAGDRVLLLDDVVSTGGTLGAVHEALEEAGAEVVDSVVVIQKGEVPDGLEIDYDWLVKADVEDGAVVILD